MSALDQISDIATLSKKSGISMRTIQRACKDGSISAKKLFKVWLVDIKSFESWKEKRER